MNLTVCKDTNILRTKQYLSLVFFITSKPSYFEQVFSKHFLYIRRSLIWVIISPSKKLFQFFPNWKESYIKILTFNHCFFQRLQIHKTTGQRVFIFELELRIHGTANSRNGFIRQKSKVEGQNSYHPQPLSCKHKPATALLVVLLTCSLKNNRLPPKSP